MQRLACEAVQTSCAAVVLALLLEGCGRAYAPPAAAPVEAHARGPANADEVSLEQAEGAHAVAIERCRTLADEAQAECLSRADAGLERARLAASRSGDGTNGRSTTH